MCELLGLLAGFLDVDQIHHEAVGPATACVLDFTPLGFSGLGWNVVVVSPAPNSPEESQFQAQFLNDQKNATDSVGYSFHIYLSDRLPASNPYIMPSHQAVFLCREDLEALFAAAVPKMALAAMIRRQTPISSQCPFNTNHEAAGSMFYGRKHELGQLVDDHVRSFAVQGARRIGKTSLLKQSWRILRNRIQEDDKRRAYYFNCLMWDDYGSSVRTLAHAIEPRRESRVALTDINLVYLFERASRGGVRPLSLFLDEVDRLIDMDSAYGWRFFRTLTTARSNGYIRFVVAGYRSVPKLLMGPHNRRTGETTGIQPVRMTDSTPLHMQLESISLGPLSPREAGQLLIEPLRSAEVKVQGESALQDAVWRATSGYPFLVQFIGHRLFTIAAASPNQPLTPEVVSSIGNGKEIQEFLETHFLENTIEDGIPVVSERSCTFLLAHASHFEWSHQDFLDACRAHRVPLGCDPFTTIKNALHNLVDAQILSVQAGKYSFSFPLIREVLTNCYPRLGSALDALQETSHVAG
ncbi:MAG: hypothetical protein NT069_05355 [Planctomycetota bacterium]|nr:hypothetical protein [Planctomycetota bacterium]